MATTYSLAAQANFNYTVTLTENLAQNSIPDTIALGSGNVLKYAPGLADGSGAGQGHNCWHDQRTVNASGNDNIVLGSGSTLINAFGVALAFTRVVQILIRLTAPAAGLRLVIGNAASNAWQAWFGATTHTEECRSFLFKENQIDGWTVAANATLLINNPTGSAITYDIIVVGN